MRVIKDNQIIEDGWQLLDAPDDPANLPAGDIIVPYAYWKDHKQQLLGRAPGALAICVQGDDPIEAVAEDLGHFKLIALNFPKFRDGRNYSHARLLRDRYGYNGELRAVGDVLHDQLFFMRRCGIDSFHVREDKDIKDALRAFSDFTVTYQTAADRAVPVYRNR